MTSKPKARKFRIRRDAVPMKRRQSADAPFASGDDGFGAEPFPGSAKAAATSQANDDHIAEIRREGLTGRQLRMARRLAQKNGLSPNSDFDAVRLLRARGIDPFDRANMLELVTAKPKETSRTSSSTQKQAETPRSKSRQPTRPQPTRASKPNGTVKNLPQKVDENSKLPGSPSQEAGFQSHELERIQRDIVRRRRRNLLFLVARLSVFVLFPTFLAWFYFAFVATPSFATKSEFVVQQAETAGASPGLLGGTSMITSQDSIMVQDFLTSREALGMLDADHGYRDHFSAEAVDVIQRVPAESSNEDLYAHFSNNVKVGYDPTEGVIRMEVSALTPDISRTFSEALIGYAEARVDRVTERKRADQMEGARESFDEAEAKMVAAQEHVLLLQEQLGVLDPASETSSLMGQISNFEVQMAEKQLQLQQLLDNAQPNRAQRGRCRGGHWKA